MALLRPSPASQTWSQLSLIPGLAYFGRISQGRVVTRDRGLAVASRALRRCIWRGWLRLFCRLLSLAFGCSLLTKYEGRSEWRRMCGIACIRGEGDSSIGEYCYFV